MYFKISVYIMLLYPCFLVSCKLDLAFIKNSFFFNWKNYFNKKLKFSLFSYKEECFSVHNHWIRKKRIP